MMSMSNTNRSGRGEMDRSNGGNMLSPAPPASKSKRKRNESGKSGYGSGSSNSTSVPCSPQAQPSPYMFSPASNGYASWSPAAPTGPNSPYAQGVPISPAAAPQSPALFGFNRQQGKNQFYSESESEAEEAASSWIEEPQDVTKLMQNTRPPNFNTSGVKSMKGAAANSTSQRYRPYEPQQNYTSTNLTNVAPQNFAAENYQAINGHQQNCSAINIAQQNYTATKQNHPVTFCRNGVANHGHQQNYPVTNGHQQNYTVTNGHQQNYPVINGHQQFHNVAPTNLAPQQHFAAVNGSQQNFPSVNGSQQNIATTNGTKLNYHVPNGSLLNYGAASLSPAINASAGAQQERYISTNVAQLHFSAGSVIQQKQNVNVMQQNSPAERGGWYPAQNQQIFAKNSGSIELPSYASATATGIMPSYESANANDMIQHQNIQNNTSGSSITFDNDNSQSNFDQTVGHNSQSIMSVNTNSVFQQQQQIRNWSNFSEEGRQDQTDQIIECQFNSNTINTTGNNRTMNIPASVFQSGIENCFLGSPSIQSSATSASSDRSAQTYYLNGRDEIPIPLKLTSAFNDLSQFFQSCHPQERLQFVDGLFNIGDGVLLDGYVIPKAVWTDAFHASQANNNGQRKAAEILFLHLFSRTEIKECTLKGKKNTKVFDPVKKSALIRGVAWLISCNQGNYMDFDYRLSDIPFPDTLAKDIESKIFTSRRSVLATKYREEDKRKELSVLSSGTTM